MLKFPCINEWRSAITPLSEMTNTISKMADNLVELQPMERGGENRNEEAARLLNKQEPKQKKLHADHHCCGDES